LALSSGAPAKPGRRRIAIALLVLLAVLALLLVRVAVWRPLAVVGEAPSDGYVRVPGVVHIHTTLSDGGGTPEEVIRAARTAGARFVVITDHNNLDAKPFEGYRDGVLVLVGTELSTTAGHILGIGIPDPGYRFSGDALDGLEDIHDLGGFAFAAHPESPRGDLRFSGWSLPGAWGLELVNGDSEWRRAGPRLLLTAALYGVNHRYAYLRSMRSVSPADATLARWDAVVAERDAPGLAGADAHSRIPVTKERALRVPSYESLFTLQRNYVLLDGPLTGQFDVDRGAVLEALRRGRLYVGLDALAPADEFSFVAKGGGGMGTMGDTVPPLPDLRLKAGGRMPHRARVALLRDGRRVAEAEGPLEIAAPGPGVYRVEVQVPGWNFPWILSNPIYIFDDAARTARNRRAGWPPAPEAPAAIEVVDDFEGKTAFRPGADANSSISADILDPRGGRDGKGAARLQFHIGEPTAHDPHVFAALVDWTQRDLRGRRGLVFSIRADGVYRLWVQVRDENPASTDEGTEWWFASLKTSAEWRRVAVPFERLRSVNPRTDGRLDLDKVRALVFVLDRGAVKPGARGTIWVDSLGVY
jgi:hypothetical protein